MLTLCHIDYDILPIMRGLYPPLVGPDGKKFVKAKLNLPRHLHDANAYPSNSNLGPEQQQGKSASPYHIVKYVTLSPESAP